MKKQLYHYHINRDQIPHDLETIVRQSQAVWLFIPPNHGKRVTESVGTSGGVNHSTPPPREGIPSVTKFLYDHDNDLLHISSFSGSTDSIFIDNLTVDNLRGLLRYSEHIMVFIDSEVLFDYPHTITEAVDYEEIITELERRGLVVTRPGEGIMTDDSRFFKFTDRAIVEFSELYIDQTEWFVGSLGTSLCADISWLLEIIWDGLQKDT